MTAENTAHPEDQQDVSMKDMLMYSGIVEQEQSIKKIKDDAENSNKPKPMDDDSAMVLYDKNLQQQASDQLQSGDSNKQSQTDDTKQEDKGSEEKEAKKEEQKPEDQTDMQISIKENKSESAEVKKNTDKWAHAKQSKIDKIAEKDDDQPVYENMSQAEYEKLFHAATVEAGKDMDKSFDQLQKEDLAKKKAEIADQKKKDAEEKANKKDVLDKQDEDTGKINDQEFDAQRIGDVPMETAMAYTDQAADKGQEFGEAATKNMTKKAEPKKEDHKEVKAKEVPAGKPKSFYEELLNVQLKDDPNALNELSKPIDLSKKDGETEAPKKSKEGDKPLEEQLWERNNPDLAQELVMQNESSQKYKEAKEAKEKQENSMEGILSEAGISDENTKL